MENVNSDWKRVESRKIEMSSMMLSIMNYRSFSELARAGDLSSFCKTRYKRNSLEYKFVMGLQNPFSCNGMPFNEDIFSIRKKIISQIMKNDNIKLKPSKILISMCLFHLHRGCSNHRVITIPIKINGKVIDVEMCYQKIIEDRPVIFRLHLDFEYNFDGKNFRYLLVEETKPKFTFNLNKFKRDSTKKSIRKPVEFVRLGGDIKEDISSKSSTPKRISYRKKLLAPKIIKKEKTEETEETVSKNTDLQIKVIKKLKPKVEVEKECILEQLQEQIKYKEEIKKYCEDNMFLTKQIKDLEKKYLEQQQFIKSLIDDMQQLRVADAFSQGKITRLEIEKQQLERKFEQYYYDDRTESDSFSVPFSYISINESNCCFDEFDMKL